MTMKANIRTHIPLFVVRMAQSTATRFLKLKAVDSIFDAVAPQSIQM